MPIDTSIPLAPIIWRRPELGQPPNLGQDYLSGVAARSRIQGENLKNKMAVLQLDNTVADQESMGQMFDGMKSDPDFLSNPGNVPAFRTPQYRAFALRLQQNYNTSVAAKMKLRDQTDFLKRMDAIDPESRAAIRGMGSPDGTITPEQYQALGLAEERAKVHAENERLMAELEAKARGDVATTTIGPKGVTTTYKPAPMDLNEQPHTTNLSDGTILAWMPGSKSLHTITPKGEHTKLTPEQMRLLSKSLRDVNPDDETAGQIDKYLTDLAKKQIGGAKPAAAAAPKTAAPKPVTEDIARQLLKETNGDKEKARALAKERGYSL